MPDLFEQEAEEIRHELTNIEEETFGDSTEIAVSVVDLDSNHNTIPLEINRRVELALKYFQTRGRKVFSIWLERSGRYENLIKPVLHENGLPENLFYLPMIESGYNPKAYSYARASGLWQFIYATGKYYGLRRSWWFDERRDPTLSTTAACEHLKDLYNRFGDWYLALAGYNCNPKKIENRMRRYKTRDFWKLKRLPRQTRNYIPTFIAANLIAENPNKYGFYIDKNSAVEYDTIKISECVDLQVVAQCVDTTFSAIKDLNPAILRWCTPPNTKDFTLNLPKGRKQIFIDNYAKIPEKQKRSWVRHRIKSGETLSQIAKKYATSIQILKNYNKIRGTLIHTGNYLVIPVPQNKNYYRTYRTYAKSRKKAKPKKINFVKGYKKIVYIVKKGDTIGEIAEVYNTRASKIRKWNGLYYGQHIYPKQKLNIWIPESPRLTQNDQIVKETNATYYVVKRGDTLWDIAKKYDTSIEKLKKLNNKRSSRIKAGEKLKVKTSNKTGG